MFYYIGKNVNRKKLHIIITKSNRFMKRDTERQRKKAAKKCCALI